MQSEFSLRNRDSSIGKSGQQGGLNSSGRGGEHPQICLKERNNQIDSIKGGYLQYDGSLPISLADP
jgi:hypothetical protein